MLFPAAIYLGVARGHPYDRGINVASERLRSTSASVNISLAPNQLTTRRQRTKLVLK